MPAPSVIELVNDGQFQTLVSNRYRDHIYQSLYDINGVTVTNEVIGDKADFKGDQLIIEFNKTNKRHARVISRDPTVANGGFVDQSTAQGAETAFLTLPFNQIIGGAIKLYDLPKMFSEIWDKTEAEVIKNIKENDTIEINATNMATQLLPVLIGSNATAPANQIVLAGTTGLDAVTALRTLSTYLRKGDANLYVRKVAPSQMGFKTSLDFEGQIDLATLTFGDLAQKMQGRGFNDPFNPERRITQKDGLYGEKWGSPLISWEEGILADVVEILGGDPDDAADPILTAVSKIAVIGTSAPLNFYYYYYDGVEVTRLSDDVNRGINIKPILRMGGITPSAKGVGVVLTVAFTTDEIAALNALATATNVTTSPAEGFDATVTAYCFKSNRGNVVA